MDIDKLKGLTIGDLVTRAQALGERLEPDNPDFADSLALSLVKSIVHGFKEDDLRQVTDLFGNYDDIAGGLFPDDDNTVSVTETSVSLPKSTELAGETTPEEDSMLDETVNPKEDDILSQILNANTEEELQAALGMENEPSEDLAGETTPEEEQMLDQAEENAAEGNTDFSDTDKTSAEEAADKPAEAPKEEKKEETPKEEKPKEEKPKEEKKEGAPKEDKPKEDNKDGSDDTMKNITSALSDRFYPA